jgi:16S rRNA (cytidine1402-2'-O)-methyltransferase
MCLCNDLTKLHEMSFRGSPAEVRGQLLAKGNYDKGEYAAVVEIAREDFIDPRERALSPEALLADAMAGGLDSREAVAAVLAQEGCPYGKNELKAALLRLKKLFGA